MRRTSHSENGPQCRGGAASVWRRSNSEEEPPWVDWPVKRSHSEEGPQCGGRATVRSHSEEEQPQCGGDTVKRSGLSAEEPR